MPESYAMIRRKRDQKSHAEAARVARQSDRMSLAGARPAIGGILYLILLATLGVYFTFAAVQGDYGVLRQVEIRAEVEVLRQDRDALAEDLMRMTNLTTRLSDHYLDLDLLDEQLRDVLGYVRADEIVIR